MKHRFNILIGCEYSATVRTAFEKLPNADLFNVWSADILPSDIPGGNHYQGDVLDILNSQSWDLLIAFPPCTYLTYAGMSHWYDEGRALNRSKAAMFFMQLYDSSVKHVCIENPQGIMNKIFRPPDQIVHPYYFGDNDMKRTCLWLKNLPALNHSYLQPSLFGDYVVKPKPIHSNINKKTGKMKNRYFTDSFIDGKFKTSLQKSKTFPGIAQAMAEQWSNYLIENQ